MTEIKKSFFSNLPRSRYLELLPNFKQEKTRAITTLALTLIALSFFGIFAINPTLSTIADLRKQIEDAQFVNQKMDQKIANLRSLQTQYAILQNDLPIILSAMPDKPQGSLLLAQLQKLTKDSSVVLFSAEDSRIILFGTPQLRQPVEPSTKLTSKAPYFTYQIGTTGTYENLSRFLSAFVQFDRIVTVENLVLGTDKDNPSQLSLFIKGTAYYQK